MAKDSKALLAVAGAAAALIAVLISKKGEAAQREIIVKSVEVT